jgi:alpha-D-ribose 1-methylphosphonate 5-triphosphate diphosphatase PhnM
MKYKILFITLLLFTTLHAKEIILFQENNHTFTQKNFNELIQFTEYLARDKLKKEDIKALKIWAIEDFKLAPNVAKTFYTKLSQDVVPYFYKKETRATYPTELYRNIINMFQKHPSKNPLNLLSIINHYNPPKKELIALQKREAQFTYQLLQMNQQNFQMIMNSTQQHANIINNAISQDSTINAIRVSGGEVVAEYDDRFIAKDAHGQEYEVIKR